MRFIMIVLAAAALAACTVETSTTTTATSGEAAAPGEGYVIELLADDDVQTFRITNPEGVIAAAQVSAGASAMVPAQTVQALFETVSPGPPEDADVVLRAPGFNLQVSGEEGRDERAHVAINIAGKDILVDAQDHGPNGQERAVVRLSGVNAETARDFIDDAEDLSPDVKAELKAAAGL
ncbi:MAG: hypothetical protein GC189_04970 [Alphaproteobacteria bacterium]|nr:hypothetical protein [Alphaproteobacteria bacterium]